MLHPTQPHFKTGQFLFPSQNWVKRCLGIVVVLCTAFSVAGQEICDNGMDDDNDNLIDLNDPDCECLGFSSTNNAPSLIPNPSFELMNCCPSSFSQLNCAQSWIQATTATSDYQNTQCYTMPAVTVPPPDGTGFVGAIFSNGWQEYVGACLLQPMLAGNEYELNMQISATSITGFGALCGPINFPAIDITIFGNPSCNQLPYSTTGCPGGNWQVLGSANYNPTTTWESFTITFTPAVDIAAVMIGSPCTLPGGYSGSCYPYFVFDNLLLNETSFFATVNINQTGTWCNDDIVLNAAADTTGGTWQWYKEGVALVGQTSTTLPVSALGLGTGTYTATYTIGNNCEWVDHVISLPDIPVSNASGNNECFPNGVTFNDLSTVASGSITSWQWNFGDNNTSTQQNPVHNYAADGTYNVELITISDINCADTFQTTVTVYPEPNAQFSVVEGCLGNASVFTDQSTVNSPGSITGFQWDFGDTNSSTQSDPNHSYTSSGQFNVDLTVTSSDGCTSSTSQPVNVYHSPIINLTVSDECAGDNMVFTNNSSIPVGSIDITGWDMGDGTTYSTFSPTHSYNNPNNYTVSLNLESDQGCTSDTSFQVTAFPNPIADFSTTDVCLNDLNTFNDLSTISGSTITSWQWDFGDLTGTSAVQSPTYTYATSGQFSVTLTTTTADGCSDNISHNLDVFELPVAVFSVNDDCLNETFQFTDQSTIANGSVNGWSWEFGDNGLSNLQDPAYVYGTEGTYSVTLISSSGQACADTVTQQVIVHPMPIADFQTDEVCPGFDMTYTDLSTIVTGTIDSHEWTFGDGASSSAASPQHPYQNEGSYTASLIVTSDFGCEDTISHPVTVYPEPTAMFSAAPVCENDVMAFSDLSTITGASIVGWDWEFGDNAGTDVAQNPNYTYTGFGNFNVLFIPMSDDGCTDTLVQEVVVNPLPEATFVFTNICEDGSAIFFDQSSVPGGGITQWDWNFGNGNISSVQVPDEQVYPVDSLYEVTLTVGTDEGCIDLFTDTIEVYPVPIANFSFDSACFPNQIQFNDLSFSNGAYPITGHAWTFTDGQTSLLQSPSIGFPTFGGYGATLLVTNQWGCKGDTTIGNVLVYPLPVANYVANFGHCVNDSAWFRDSSSVEILLNDSIIDWTYDLGDGSTSDQPTVSHLYATSGFYNAELLVETNHGCKDSTTYPVEVYPRPSVAWTADPGVGCIPLTVNFSDNSSIPEPYSLIGWEWDLGVDSNSVYTIPNPSFVYHPSNVAPLDSVTYDITLKVTSLQGCESTMTEAEQVVVHPVPEAFFHTDPNEVTSIIDPVFEMLDRSSENVVQWFWEFDDGGISTDQNPVHEFPDTGIYTITLHVTSDDGCTDAVDYEVIVHPTFTFYIPNAFTPNSDGVNESFIGQGTGFIDYSMSIYDRWGELLFFSKNPELPWDGTFKGHQVEQGQYVYKFKLVDWSELPHEYIGGFTLFK